MYIQNQHLKSSTITTYWLHIDYENVHDLHNWYTWVGGLQIRLQTLLTFEYDNQTMGSSMRWNPLDIAKKKVYKFDHLKNTKKCSAVIILVWVCWPSLITLLQERVKEGEAPERGHIWESRKLALADAAGIEKSVTYYCSLLILLTLSFLSSFLVSFLPYVMLFPPP